MLKFLLSLLLCLSVFAQPSFAQSSKFVLLSDFVPDLIVDLRYASTYNFVGERIHGYEEKCVILTREAALALARVADSLRPQGYTLKIYDAYRPQSAVDHFIAWAKDPKQTRMKQDFYPAVPKTELLSRGYIAKRSGHSRGSAVDLTLVYKGKELDMGGTFDFFGEQSHVKYTKLTKEQAANRKLLRKAMYTHGFVGIGEEWWHFKLKKEPYPNSYFTFPVKKSSVY